MIGRLRPYEPSSDEDGVVYLWLKSFAHSRYGRALGAHVPRSEAELRYWAEHRQVVMRLLTEAQTLVVCDPEAESVIWGFATTQPEVVHYVSCKRSFHREGLSVEMIRQLLGPLLGKPCVMTHELVELCREELRGKLSIPSTWRHDPYWLARAWGGPSQASAQSAA